MFKHNIDPSQIPFLVRLTADLFRTASKEVTDLGASKYTAKNMHFIADMFKDLVNTAYPIDQLEDEESLKKELKETIAYMQFCTPQNIFPAAFMKKEKDGGI